MTNLIFIYTVARILAPKMRSDFGTTFSCRNRCGRRRSFY